MNARYLIINSHDYCEGFLKDFKIDLVTKEVCSGIYIDYDSPQYGDPYEYNVSNINEFPEHIINCPSDEEIFELLDKDNNSIGFIYYEIPKLIKLFCEDIHYHTFELFFEKKDNKLYVKTFDNNIEELISQDNWIENN